MIGEVFDYLAQGLHLGAGRAVLGQMLGPAARPGRRLRVLAPGGHLLRPLRAAGFEVLALGEDGAFPEGEPPDAVCVAAGAPLDLPGEFASWARLVRPGGVVLLVTRRGRPKRQALCAALLHAGLAEPAQRTAGVAVCTAGRVLRRPDLHA